MSPYVAGGQSIDLNGILSAMQWYMVTKNIGGRPYLYRQRTYREGGKVRTQCQYVGAASDTSVSPAVSDVSAPFFPATEAPEQSSVQSSERPSEPLPEPGSLKINWENAANPFWPSIRRFHAERAKPAMRRDKVSVSAMKAEYARVARQLEHLGLDGTGLTKVRLLEGKTRGWKRIRSGYHVTLARGKNGSGRNRFKRDYRHCLAQAMLDQIEAQNPSLYDGLRTIMDRSWFNTKMLVTLQILRLGKEHGSFMKGRGKGKGRYRQLARVLMAARYLWSGTLPKALQNKTGQDHFSKRHWSKPVGWRDEAATLIADVIQRGYQPSLKKLERDRSKAKMNAKRAFTNYRKLSSLERLSAKGRKKWKLYKKHETDFLIAHQRQSRLEMLKPLLGDFHKRGR